MGIELANLRARASPVCTKSVQYSRHRRRHLKKLTRIKKLHGGTHSILSGLIAKLNAVHDDGGGEFSSPRRAREVLEGQGWKLTKASRDKCLVAYTHSQTGCCVRAVFLSAPLASDGVVPMDLCCGRAVPIGQNWNASTRLDASGRDRKSVV